MPTKKLILLFVLGLLYAVPCSLQAQEESPSVVSKVTLSCGAKNASENENQVFPVVKGQGVELRCTLVNTTQEKLSGILLGKQYANDTVAASSTAVNLDEDARQEITLSFPMLFVPGNYRYAVVLMGSDNQPLSKEIVLTGALEGEQQLTIDSVALDKTGYVSGDMVILSLALSAEGEEEALLKAKEPMLKVSLLDVEQKDCSVLLNGQAVTEITAEYSFQLSPQANCTNTLQVTLADKDGGVMDQKIVAVSVREQETAVQNALKQPSSGSSKKAMIVMWGSIAGIVLLAYFIWRHRRA